VRRLSGGCAIKLLVSVINDVEAVEAVKGGAHIIDVKNPNEGSLGANFPRIIRRVREVVPKSIEVSATIGDLPNLPGTASLAALGAAFSGADYVKAGLFGVKNASETLYLLREVCKAVKDFNPNLKVIAGGYADYKDIGSINPLKLPEIAYAAGADGVIVDIKVKDVKRKIYDLLNVAELKKFVEDAHRLNLTGAIAGSLSKEDIPLVYSLGADIIGVRGSVCSSGDRLNGAVRAEMVREFVNEIRRLTGDNVRANRPFTHKYRLNPLRVHTVNHIAVQSKSYKELRQKFINTRPLTPF
jgi:uncharacterized protein (UPF0264 family)